MHLLLPVPRCKPSASENLALLVGCLALGGIPAFMQAEIWPESVPLVSVALAVMGLAQPLP